ncbi:MAG: hypothetical protein HPY53_12970 [Brevinematales bacterium]|nr:hypothetical protein [Brevinematales bacterium]
MKYWIIVLMCIIPTSPAYSGDFINPAPGGNDFLNPDYTSSEADKKAKALNTPGGILEGIYVAPGFDILSMAPNVLLEFWNQNFAVDIWIYGHMYSRLVTYYDYYLAQNKSYIANYTGVSFGVEARYFLITGIFSPSVSAGISPDIVDIFRVGLNGRVSLRICPADFLFIEPFAGIHLTIGDSTYFQAGFLLGFKL